MEGAGSAVEGAGSALPGSALANMRKSLAKSCAHKSLGRQISMASDGDEDLAMPDMPKHDNSDEESNSDIQSVSTSSGEYELTRHKPIEIRALAKLRKKKERELDNIAYAHKDLGEVGNFLLGVADPQAMTAQHGQNVLYSEEFLRAYDEVLEDMEREEKKQAQTKFIAATAAAYMTPYEFLPDRAKVKHEKVSFLKLFMISYVCV